MKGLAFKSFGRTVRLFVHRPSIYISACVVRSNPPHNKKPLLGWLRP